MGTSELAALLGNVGKFVASVGVLITLAILAFQIRQNTRETRLANAHRLFEASRQTVLASVGPAMLAETIAKSAEPETLTDPDPDPDPERVALSNWIVGNIRNLEAAYVLWSAGSLEDAVIDSYGKRAQMLYQRFPAFRDIWDVATRGLTPGFAGWLERALASDG